MYLKHYKINGGTTTQMHQLIRTKDFHLNLYSRVQSWQSKKGKIVLVVTAKTKPKSYSVFHFQWVRSLPSALLS